MDMEPGDYGKEKSNKDESSSWFSIGKEDLRISNRFWVFSENLSRRFSKIKRDRRTQWEDDEGFSK